MRSGSSTKLPLVVMVFVVKHSQEKYVSLKNVLGEAVKLLLLLNLEPKVT